MANQTLDGNIENNRLSRIIFHPNPSRHFLFLLSPACQVEVESDRAKLISDDSSSDAVDIDTEINEGTKFGKLGKPMFSLFDVIMF